MDVKLYLTTELRTQNRHLTNEAANFFLTPVRHFLSGKTYAIIGKSALEVFDHSPDSWHKTALMIAAFIPGLILGAFARWFSTVHEEVREGFSLINRASSEPPSPHSSPFSSRKSSVGSENEAARGRHSSRSSTPGSERDAHSDDDLAPPGGGLLPSSSTAPDGPSRRRLTASGGELSPSVSGSEDDEPPTGPRSNETTGTDTGSTKNTFAVLRRSPSVEELESVVSDNESTSSEEIETSFDYSDSAQLKINIGACLNFFASASSIGAAKAPTWLETQTTALQFNPFVLCSDLASEETHLVPVIGKSKYDRLEQSYQAACARMKAVNQEVWLTKVPVVE